MFSTQNSALVAHSDGMFTRYSASTNCTNGDLKSDLIAFLSIVQQWDVDFLPISWQPSLGNLGQGGSGVISQSTIITGLPLAFKRFHDSEDCEPDFLPLISEVLILSQPPIRDHPNIVNLKGICWEIKRRTEHAIPVLVFEKAAWDLHQFMKVREGRNMSAEERLKICVDIGSAIVVLHANGVIHGDIKPQNVLVFKDDTGKTTIRVADFGYSTLATGEEASILLPKSKPWNAPEHHFGVFTLAEAKKADVYSFGRLCLWALCGRTHDPPGGTECMAEVASFDPSTEFRPSFEELKVDEVEHFAYQFIESMQLAGLNDQQRCRLKEFFKLTLEPNPEKRTADVGKLMVLLSPERAALQPITVPFQATTKFSVCTNFRISQSLGDLVEADYRVRMQIKDSLEKNYIRNQKHDFAAEIAFQLAFCYDIGFGTKSDDIQRQVWLAKSIRQLDDLNVEKEAVQPAWRKMREIDGVKEVDLIYEYRTWGRQKLEEAQVAYEREIRDMEREFGEIHHIPLTLCNILGNLLDEIREFQKAKELRLRIRDQIGTDVIDHPYYIQSIVDVAQSHINLGEWMAAQQLLENALKHSENTQGHTTQSLAVTSIRGKLAVTLCNQGQWKEAEAIQVQIMQTRKRVLGQQHPDTLGSMNNLALTYWNQGRLKEAEELLMQVMETNSRVLGQEHPDTLTSRSNLAEVYRAQGRLQEAEQLEVQVMETKKRVLGQDHPNTLTSMVNLASTYSDQGRWQEAEALEVQVIELSKELGEKHPDTLTTKYNLSTTFVNQGRWKMAEELQVQVLEMTKRILGEEHPDTLTSLDSLATTFWQQGRWKDAEELYVGVLETRKKLLGEEHPDTLLSMGNLAMAYKRQERLKEAEELEVQVMETRKRVLGEEHPNTLRIMGDLASTFSDQGRLEESENLLVQVMETSSSVLGLEHPDTLMSMAYLSSTFSDQGRMKEAEELLVKVMETRRRVLGQEHPDTLTSMANLASTYSDQERWQEAEALEVQVIEMRTRILGEKHPDTLKSVSNLASTFWNQERLREAEVLDIQVLDTRRRVLGEEHPDTLTSMANLASTFSDQERWQEAEALEMKVMETRKRQMGEEHLDTLASMNSLASILWNQGRWMDAKDLHTQVINTMSVTLGEDHPSTVSAIDDFALLREQCAMSRQVMDEGNDGTLDEGDNEEITCLDRESSPEGTESDHRLQKRLKR